MASILGLAIRRHLSKTAQRYAVDGPSASAGDHAGGMKLWRNLSFFVGLPACVLCAVNAFLKHQEEGHARPEFVPYDYLRVRSRKYPWGDGSRTLFHNPHANALPSGYEDGH